MNYKNKPISAIGYYRSCQHGTVKEMVASNSESSIRWIPSDFWDGSAVILRDHIQTVEQAFECINNSELQFVIERENGKIKSMNDWNLLTD